MPYKDAAQQKAATSQWQRDNRERVNAKSRRWKARNAEHCKAYGSEAKKNNRAYYTAIQANRRAAQHKATPPWADKTQILAIYKACPPGHEVDHIVPLLGRNVCGLHVHWNLQILPKVDNRRKSNKCL